MSDKTLSAPAPSADLPATTVQETEAPGEGLLSQILEATKHTAPERARTLVETFVAAVDAKAVKFDKNLTRSIQSCIDECDAKISAQLNEIMHADEVKALEGTWRGLQYLVSNSKTGQNVKIKVLNASKEALARNLERAVDFDQSHLWKIVYDSGFGQAGGEPFAALIGDYQWDNGFNDVQTLQQIAGVAAASFAPFISAPAPKLLGLTSWTELNTPRQLEAAIDGPEYTRWRSFRESDDARFVTLAMPRVMARRPYGKTGITVDKFRYEELPVDANGEPGVLQHDNYCWMNAAYTMGARLTTAFSDTGFCTAIRGETNGGKVEGLPLHSFVGPTGEIEEKCPTEVNIPDRREVELSQIGLLPLVHYKSTDFAVFIGGQTVQKAASYDSEDDRANAKIATRLPYVMATGRFAHYLKVIAREKLGGSMGVEEVQSWLNTWISHYVNSVKGGAKLRAERPLREARVEVREVPGLPGVFNAVALLRPWLQMEELNASLRMVARIPKRN